MSIVRVRILEDLLWPGRAESTLVRKKCMEMTLQCAKVCYGHTWWDCDGHKNAINSKKKKHRLREQAQQSLVSSVPSSLMEATACSPIRFNILRKNCLCCAFFNMWHVQGSCQVKTQIFEVLHNIHFFTIYVKWGVCCLSGSMMSMRISFVLVEHQVVFQTPFCEMFKLLQVACLLIIGDQSNYSGVISKLHDGVGGMDGVAFMSKEWERAGPSTHPNGAPLIWTFFCWYWHCHSSVIQPSVIFHWSCLCPTQPCQPHPPRQFTPLTCAHSCLSSLLLFFLLGPKMSLVWLSLLLPILFSL